MNKPLWKFMGSAQGKPLSATPEQVTEPARSSEPPAGGVQELGCGLRGWGCGMGWGPLPAW